MTKIRNIDRLLANIESASLLGLMQLMANIDNRYPSKLTGMSNEEIRATIKHDLEEMAQLSR